MRRIVAVIALGAAAVGCSTVDPTPKLKSATSAIDAAKAAGATNFPSSSSLLSEAEKRLGIGQTMIKDGNAPDAVRNLSVAGAAGSNAKVTATEASNTAQVKALDAQIADLKTKLGM